jgi:hypothetical protein
MASRTQCSENVGIFASKAQQTAGRLIPGRLRGDWPLSRSNLLIVLADFGWERSTPSTISNMSRMRFSDTGLSTTTTSSGLLEDARTSPQLPSSIVIRTPLTVTRSRIAWAADPGALALRRLEILHHGVDDIVLHLVGATRRHGRRRPGLRQRILQIGHRLAARAIEHVADRDRRDQTVVIAAAEWLVEEEVAGLLKARERPELVGAAVQSSFSQITRITSRIEVTRAGSTQRKKKDAEK